MNNFPQIELLKPAKVKDCLRKVHGIVHEVANSVIAVVAKKTSDLIGRVVVVYRENTLVLDGVVRIGGKAADRAKTFLLRKHSFEVVLEHAVLLEVPVSNIALEPLHRFRMAFNGPWLDTVTRYKALLLTVFSGWAFWASRPVQDHIVLPKWLATPITWLEHPSSGSFLSCYRTVLGFIKMPANDGILTPLMVVSQPAGLAFEGVPIRPVLTAREIGHRLNDLTGCADIVSGGYVRQLVAVILVVLSEVPSKYFLAAKGADYDWGFESCLHCRFSSSRINLRIAADMFVRQASAIFSIARRLRSSIQTIVWYEFLSVLSLAIGLTSSAHCIYRYTDLSNNISNKKETEYWGASPLFC